MKKFLISILIPLFCLSIINLAHSAPPTDYLSNSTQGLKFTQFAQLQEKDSSVTTSVETKPGSTAASVQSKDWTFVLGYKGWYNQWQTSMFSGGPNSERGSQNIETTSDNYELASIPFASIKYKDFFISGSYFLETSYDFPAYTQYVNYTAQGLGYRLVNTKISAKRTEWDVNLGYYILSSPIAVSAGWKNVTQKYSTTESSPGLVYTPPTTDQKVEMEGPVLGISTSYPLGSGFYFYGAFAYGWLTLKIEGNKLSDVSCTYTLYDLGVGYKIPEWPVTLSLGYRVQDIHSKIDAGANADFTNEATDITKGVVFGLNIIF